jgi:hypothetical protein
MPLLHRYTADLDLVTDKDPEWRVGRKIFLNYGTKPITTADAKDIIAALEEFSLDAIDVVDGLAAQREMLTMVLNIAVF